MMTLSGSKGQSGVTRVPGESKGLLAAEVFCVGVLSDSLVFERNIEDLE